MINDPQYPASSAYLVHQRSFFSSISWGAIFAGLAAALAFEVLFMFLGAGLGFAIYTPLTDAKPLTDFGAGALIIQGLSAVFSLWFGGWVAGRVTPVHSRLAGALHGLLVWCSATVAGILLVSLGAGWAMGDLSKLVGGGLSMAGKPAAAAVNDAAKDGAKQTSEMFSSFTDEGVGSRPADGGKAGAIRAKRDVSLAIAKLFNPMQSDQMQTNHAALVKVLHEEAGMSQEDAEKTVNDWTASYNDVKAQAQAAKDEAAAKAREAANESARVMAVLSFVAFVGLGFGAVAATLGGKCGAKHARKYDVQAVPVA